MSLLNSLTFNVCKDNAKAADALVAVIKAKGHNAERLEVPQAALDHAAAMGQASPPAAVAHDAPFSAIAESVAQLEKDS